MGPLTPLIAGLVIFLSGHMMSRIQAARNVAMGIGGRNVYFALYSLIALMGLAMIVHGFSVYRAAGYIHVWEPPRFFTHLAMVLIWLAMILIVATYAPGRIKAKAKHPMLAGIKAWALAHLLVNGDLGSIILFGSFLGWAVFTRIALKRAGLGEGNPADEHHPNAQRNDATAVIAGSAITLAMIFGLHKALIGVAIL